MLTDYMYKNRAIKEKTTSHGIFTSLAALTIPFPRNIVFIENRQGKSE